MKDDPFFEAILPSLRQQYAPALVVLHEQVRLLTDRIELVEKQRDEAMDWLKELHQQGKC